MDIPKPIGAERSRFRGLVPDAPDVEMKPMFGTAGAFVNGDMFVGLFGSDVGVKLPAAAGTRLVALSGAGPFGPAERPVSGDVALPYAWTAPKSAAWVQRALTAARTVPATQPRQRPAKRAAR